MTKNLELKNLPDTVHNQLKVLVENINYPYEKVDVGEKTGRLEIAEVVRRIERGEKVHLYVKALCRYALNQIMKKEEANKRVERMVASMLVNFEDETKNISAENSLLKKELKFIKEEHNFLKKEIAGTLSTLRIEVTPSPEEPEEEPKTEKKKGFNG